jgi:hypothetical protein
MDDVTKLSEIDRALADALDVDVSADFVARVRQRIAVEATPSPFRFGWRIVLPPAAAALVVVAVGGALLLGRSPAPPRLLAARSVSVQLRPAAARPPVVRSGPVPSLRVASAPANALREPEVLIPREEIEMYRRLIAAAQHVPQAVVVEAQPVIMAGPFIPEITIDPIRIDLIVPPVGGEGDRQ